MLDTFFSVFSLIGSSCIPLEQQVVKALKKGHFAYARFLIEKNPELLSNPSYGHSPLTLSIINDQADYAQWCIERAFPLIDEHRVGALTPLSAALFRGNLELVVSLINAGISVNQQCIDGHYPLHYAALYCPPAVKILLDRGANPNALNYQEDTPLALAIVSNLKYESSGKKMLESLLLAGANPYVLINATGRSVRDHLVDDIGVVPEAQELLDILDLGCSVAKGISRATLKGLAIRELLRHRTAYDIAQRIAVLCHHDDFEKEYMSSPSPELFALKYLKKYSKPPPLAPSQIQ